MKRTTKRQRSKLTLARETVRQLDGKELSRPAGGTTACPTQQLPCPTEPPQCPYPTIGICPIPFTNVRTGRCCFAG